MKILKRINMLCTSCMERHKVQVVRVMNHNVYNGVEVDYTCNYYYCDRTDEFYADESMVTSNDIEMKRAYSIVNSHLLSAGVMKEL